MRTKTPELADRILDAAALLFARQRFHVVRMDNIADAADVSKGTLYSYFKDKEKLYVALLERGSKGMIEAMQLAVAEHDEPLAQLVAFVQSVLTYFDDEPHLFDLIQRVEIMSASTAEFPWQQARDVAERLVRGIFEKARVAGAFEIGDPEVGMWLLFGGIRTVIRFGRRPRPARLAEKVVEIFLYGAAPR